MVGYLNCDQWVHRDSGCVVFTVPKGGLVPVPTAVSSVMARIYGQFCGSGSDPESTGSVDPDSESGTRGARKIPRIIRNLKKNLH